MADNPEQPYNPSAPPHTTTGQQTTAGAAPPPGRTDAQQAVEDLLRGMSEAAKATKESADATKAAAEAIKDAAQASKEAAKEAKGWGEGIKGAADAIDSYAEGLDRTEALTKKLGKAKGIAEQKKALEELLAVQEQLEKSGLANSKQMRDLSERTKQLRQGLSDLSKGKELDTFTRQWKNLLKVQQQVTRHSQHLPQSVQKLHKADDAVRKFLKVSPAGFDRLHQVVEIGHNLREKTRQKQRERSKRFQEKQKEAQAFGTQPTIGVLGDIVASRYSKAKSAQEAGLGKGPGWINRKLMGVVEQGEGSFSKGLLRSVPGALSEFGGSTLTALSGGAALVGIIGGLVNKNQVMNAEVEKALGGGGILAGQDSRTAFSNVRSNLGGGYLSPTTRLGVGYDKNLAIAQALQEGGFSVSNLADRVGTKDKNGMLMGGFGSLQRNVYAYGRMAGLGSDKTMEQTIKLMSQYHQSLASTENFFVQINKDTIAAGISTQRYIGLIDEVNSHYDRANQLLGVTLTTMRMLGSTGRETADSMKDSMEALTNSGKQFSPEQTAYLYNQILGQQGGAQKVRGISTFDREYALRNTAAAFVGPNSDNDPNYDKKVDAKVEELRKMVAANPGGAITALGSQSDAQYERENAGDERQRNQAQLQRNQRMEALKNLGLADLRTQGVNASLAGPQAAMGLMGVDQNMGANPHTQMLLTMQAVETALNKATQGRLGVRDLTGPNGGEIVKNFGLNQLMTTFGLTAPQMMNTLPDTLRDIAATRGKLEAGGISQEERDTPGRYVARMTDYQKAFAEFKAQGTAKFGFDDKAKEGEAQAIAVRDFLNKHPEKANEMLAQQRSTVDSISDPEFMKLFVEKITQKERDKSLAGATDVNLSTVSFDEYKKAFENWFGSLLNLLNPMLRIMQQNWGGGAVSESLDQQVAGEMTANSKGVTPVDTAIKNAENRRPSMKSLILGPGADDVSPGDIARASKIRADSVAGKPISADDKTFLDDFFTKTGDPNDVLHSLGMTFDKQGNAEIADNLDTGITKRKLDMLSGNNLVTVKPEEGKPGVSIVHITTTNYNTDATINPTAVDTLHAGEQAQRKGKLRTDGDKLAAPIKLPPLPKAAVPVPWG